MKCIEPGCENGTDNGHALYRVNEKGAGQGFEGKCILHYPDPDDIDPVVRAVAEAFSCEVEEGEQEGCSD